MILLCLIAMTVADAKAVPLSIRNPSQVRRREVVQVSLPIAKGVMANSVPQAITVAGVRVPAQAAVITRHPDRSARRVMVCVPVELEPGQSVAAQYESDGAVDGSLPSLLQGGRIQTQAYSVAIDGDRLRILKPGSDAPLATVLAFGPELDNPRPATSEVLYQGPYFVWLRWRQQGEKFGRELDVQADVYGRLKLTQRVQSHLGQNAWTPDFGFEVSAVAKAASESPAEVRFLSLDPRSRFSEHPELTIGLTLAGSAPVALANPLALRQHRGMLAVRRQDGQVVVRASRLEPVAKEDDQLMIQDGQWRVVELMLQPGKTTELAAAIDAPLVAHADWTAYDAVYQSGPPLEVKSPLLRSLADRYVQYMQRMSIDGDDWGNMTSYSPTNDRAAINSMVRYNHCQYVWEDFFRTGDPRLLKIARDWSENYRNLSVYWGRNKEYYGGSRRGRAYRDDPEKGAGPGTYMVRFDYARCYVTKGYRNFWLAYEETGDPRFKEAVEAQARWSSTNVHCDRGEMRNVGMIADFAKLYRYTGEKFYLDQAVRLWEQFQTKQMPDLMFTQSGKPATGNELYILDDNHGYKHPFYKAYITQYATNSLPYLLEWRADDQRLRQTIFACNDWMAGAQTAGGAWSYPGPTSAGMRWTMEYCHGLALACAIDPKPAYLDAIQRTLRAIVGLFEQHDRIPSQLDGWEQQTGVKLTAETYHLGTDRDRSKDYTHGRIGFDASPDSIVYFQVVLRDYLRHCNEDSLFTPDPIVAQLRKLPTSGTR